MANKKNKPAQSGEISNQNGSEEQTQPGIKSAISAVQKAQEHLADFARERTSKQLSICALATINRDLQSIERRLSVYDKD